MNETYLTLAETGRRLGRKCAKTISRWTESLPGFPQPIYLGESPVIIEQELDAYIEKLKQERGKRRRKK